MRKYTGTISSTQVKLQELRELKVYYEAKAALVDSIRMSEQLDSLQEETRARIVCDALSLLFQEYENICRELDRIIQKIITNVPQDGRHVSYYVGTSHHQHVWKAMWREGKVSKGLHLGRVIEKESTNTTK